MATYTYVSYAYDPKNGQALVNCPVVVKNADTGAIVSSTTTNAVGKFTLSALDSTINYKIEVAWKRTTTEAVIQSSSSAPSPTTVRIDSGGADTGSQPRLNFISGANIEVTGANDAGNAEIDVTIALDDDHLGFFGATPVVQQAAYTQTYATADKTHANPTSSTLTDNSGGAANTTIQALTNPADAPATADALRDDLVANLIPELRNNIADLAAQVNALRVDLLDAKQVVNSLIDDLQAYGLAG